MEHIIFLLYKYKYVLLFPLAIVEGPILAVIAGFLCMNNYLNPFIAYPIIVIGDITGDTLIYIVGRFRVPRFVKKIAKISGFKPEKIQQVRSYFGANPARVISLSKITLGIGIAGIYLAGNAGIPYKKFIRICFVTSALQYIFYLGLGLIFGGAYKQISHYIDFFSAFMIAIVLAFLLLYFIKSRFNKL